MFCACLPLADAVLIQQIRDLMDDLDVWPWPYSTFAYWTIALYLLGKTSSNFYWSYLSYGHSSDTSISLAVFMTSIYGYIMFSTILWKCIFGHTFSIKAARMMILVSKTMFLGSRNQMALLILCCIWPCLISGLWKFWSGSLSCLYQ